MLYLYPHAFRLTLGLYYYYMLCFLGWIIRLVFCLFEHCRLSCHICATSFVDNPLLPFSSSRLLHNTCFSPVLNRLIRISLLITPWATVRKLVLKIDLVPVSGSCRSSLPIDQLLRLPKIRCHPCRLATFCPGVRQHICLDDNLKSVYMVIQFPLEVHHTYNVIVWDRVACVFLAYTVKYHDTPDEVVGFYFILFYSPPITGRTGWGKGYAEWP